MKRKKGQAWSMDISLAVVLFIVAFFIIYAIVSGNTDGTEETESMSKQGEEILEKLLSEDSDLSVVSNGEINETKMENLLSQDYSDLKKEAGISDEFCVYLEDEDGNIIPIQSSAGIGWEEINLSDNPCG